MRCHERYRHILGLVFCYRLLFKLIDEGDTCTQIPILCVVDDDDGLYQDTLFYRNVYYFVPVNDEISHT